MIRHIISILLAMLLIGLAIGFADVDSFELDWRVVMQPKAWAVALLVGLNLILTAGLWWVATLPFDAAPRVGLWRMTALLGASGLLNFLPMRPGLLGRAAFLKVHHGLAVKQSMLSLLIVLMWTGVVCAGMTLTALWPMEEAGLWSSEVGLLLVAGLAWFAAPMTRLIAGDRATPDAWMLPTLKAADVLVAGVRLWLAFALVGAPISFEQALLGAAVGVFVAAVGLTPNGLGLKEWLIAAVAAATPVGSDAGLRAAMLDRVIEFVVLLPAGLASLWWLSLRRQPK